MKWNKPEDTLPPNGERVIAEIERKDGTRYIGTTWWSEHERKFILYSADAKVLQWAKQL